MWQFPLVLETCVVKDQLSAQFEPHPSSLYFLCYLDPRIPQRTPEDRLDGSLAPTHCAQLYDLLWHSFESSGAWLKE